MIEFELPKVVIDSELEHFVEEILKKIGISSSEAINLFYKQIAVHEDLPFAFKPKEDLLDSMVDVMLKRNLSEPCTFGEFEKKYFKC